MKTPKYQKMSKNLPELTSVYSKTIIIGLVCFLTLAASCVHDKSEDLDHIKSLLVNGFGIHNATLLVENLDSTRTYYSETLGFAEPREPDFDPGEIAGTVSATIGFPDMFQLELTAYKDSLSKTIDKKNVGFTSYSLSSSSIDQTNEWLSAQGFNMDSIKPFRFAEKDPEGWDWDDGGAELLTVGFEDRGLSQFLPEFKQLTNFPYERMHEWKSFYNMQRGFIRHPNGVVGVSALRLVVEDLSLAKAEFKKMGLQLLAVQESENTARFKLERNQELLINSPQSSDDDYSKFLESDNSGLYAIQFEVLNLDSTYNFFKEKLPETAYYLDSAQQHLVISKDYTFGIQLEFKQEPEEQALTAQKLNMSGQALDSVAEMNAEAMYLKYCALCHGENREGYAADNAPSLRSHSLISTAYSTNFLRYTIQYGRSGTAMAGYYKELGGPLELIEIELLLKWLYEKSGVEEPIELSREPIKGDVQLGSVIYADKCSVCHGVNGEGVTAPALGNPMLLATATDEFLKYAITEGRDSSMMPAFKDSLSKNDINAVTAFLRSRASGWDIPNIDSITVPEPEDYVLNPTAKSPEFNLREDLYVSAEQVNQALKDSLRMVILDARSKVAWRQTHIPGSIPVPYYEEPEAFIEHIPNDSTWVIAYCACPHAASQKVVKTLKRYGFKKTAIIDEGILVWAQLGYPVLSGQ